MAKRLYGSSLEENQRKAILNAIIESTYAGKPLGTSIKALGDGIHPDTIKRWIGKYFPDDFQKLKIHPNYLIPFAQRYPKNNKPKEKGPKKSKLITVDLDHEQEQREKQSVPRERKPEPQKKVVVLIGEPSSIQDLMKSALEGMR